MYKFAIETAVIFILCLKTRSASHRAVYTYTLCRVLMEKMAYLDKQVPLEIQEGMGGQVDLG